MYNILHNMATINKTPWEIPLEQRCCTLRRYLEEGFQVVLLMYERPDTSTFRYRGYNIFKALAKSQKWRSIYFFRNEITTIIPYISSIKLLVVIRMQWSHMLNQLIFRAKADGVPVAFDVDDLVFDIDYLPLVTNTLNVNFNSENDYDFWFAYISRIGYTASLADCFITTNTFLGDRLESKFRKPYGIIPNFLNEEQLFISEKCASKKAVQKSKKPFTIGYFSGTPSHINDFRTVYKELLQLLEEFNDIQLSVVGFMEFPPELQHLIKAGKITFTPLVDFLELQRLTAQVDVNIVPLVLNTFTNCKSELKFFEAAIVRTVTFAAPNFSYRNCITDGVNGFLCKQGEWYRKIKAVYLNEIKVADIIKKAYDYSMDHYQGQVVLDKIEQCYDCFKK
jgi:glycosyltransferase involved in cell wall biosynthesis